MDNINKDKFGDWPEGFEQRLLPTIILGGIEFEVDGFYGELRQVENVGRSFLFSQMDYFGMGHNVLYQERGQPNFDVEPIFRESVRHTVRDIVELDPVGVSLRFGISIEDLPLRDSALRSNTDWVERRIQGYLPIISLPNQDFSIDLAHGKLNSCDNAYDSIDLTKTIEFNSRNFLYYDFLLKTLHDPFKSFPPSNIPANVVFVELPHKFVLDPYQSFGLSNFSDKRRILADYPPTPHLKARIFTLDRSPMRHIYAQCQKPDKRATNQEIKTQRGSSRKRLH